MAKPRKELKTITQSERSLISVWKDYIVTFHFTTPIYGGFPAGGAVLHAFINKKIKDGALRPVEITQTATGVMEVRREGLSLDELRQHKIDQALEGQPEQS